MNVKDGPRVNPSGKAWPINRDSNYPMEGNAPDPITSMHGMFDAQKLDAVNNNSSMVQGIQNMPYTGLVENDSRATDGKRRVTENNFITVAKGQTGTEVIRKIIIVYTMFPGADGARLIDEVCSPKVIDFNTIEVYIDQLITKTIQPTVVTEFGSGFGPAVTSNRIPFAPFTISFATNFGEVAQQETANGPMYNSLILIAIGESYRDFLICYCIMLFAANYSTPRSRALPSHQNSIMAHDDINKLEIQAIGCFDRAKNPVPQMLEMLDLVLTNDQLIKVDTIVMPAELRSAFGSKMNAPAFITGKTEEESARSSLSNLTIGGLPMRVLFINSKTEAVSGDSILSQDYHGFLMATPRLSPLETLVEMTTLCMSGDNLITTTVHDLMQAAEIYFKPADSMGKRFMIDPTIDHLRQCHLYQNGVIAPNPFYTEDPYGGVAAIKLIGHMPDEFNPTRVLIQKVKQWLSMKKEDTMFAYSTSERKAKAVSDTLEAAKSPQHNAAMGVFNSLKDALGLSSLDSMYADNDSGLFLDFCVVSNQVPSIESVDVPPENYEFTEKKTKTPEEKKETFGISGITTGKGEGKQEDPKAEQDETPVSSFVAAKYNVSKDFNGAKLANILGINLDDMTGEKKQEVMDSLNTFVKQIKEWKANGAKDAGFKTLMKAFEVHFWPEQTIEYKEKANLLMTARNFLIAVKGDVDASEKGEPKVKSDAKAYTHSVPVAVYRNKGGASDKLGAFYDFSLLGEKLNSVYGDHPLAHNYVYGATVARLLHTHKWYSENSSNLFERLKVLDTSRDHPLVLGITALLLLAEFTHENMIFLLEEGLPLPVTQAKLVQIYITGLSIFFLAGGGQSVQLMFSYPENRIVPQRGVYQYKFITRARVGGIRIPTGPIYGFPMAKIRAVRSTDANYPMKKIDFEFGNNYNMPSDECRGYAAVWLPANNTDDSRGTCFSMFNVLKSTNEHGNNYQGSTKFFFGPVMMASSLDTRAYIDVIQSHSSKYKLWPHNTIQDIGKKNPTLNSGLIHLADVELTYFDQKGTLRTRKDDSLNPYFPNGSLYNGAIAKLTGDNIGDVTGGPQWLYQRRQ